MSVTVVYSFEPVDANHPVTANFEDWVATLTSAEQDAVKAAKQKHGVQQHILEYANKLQVTYTPNMTYTWATSADADAGIPAVPEWDAIVARYLSENNAKITTVRT